MNVIIEKTVPLFYTPNQTMYPGASPICFAHEVHFSNLEGKTQAQIWIWDVAYNKFLQKSTVGPIVNGVMTLPITVLPSPTTGIMVLLFSTSSPLEVSNKFTYSVNDSTIVGGSTNLGDATVDAPFSNVPVAPVVLPSPLSTKKHKRN